MFKANLRFKTTVFISLIVISLLGVGIGLGYYLGYELLQKNTGNLYTTNARLMAAVIKEMVLEEQGQLKYFLEQEPLRQVLREKNAFEEKMPATERQKFFADMDRKWAATPFDDLSRELNLSFEVNGSLAWLVSERENTSEIFVTDRYGGLAAASGKTSDFYQADEAWWQKAFAGGKGRNFLGDVHFDKSAGQYAVALAFPIRDKNGDILGICKSLLRLDQFFRQLKNFNIGQDGHAVLVDEAGNILYYPGITPMQQKFMDLNQLNAVLANKRHWTTLDAFDGRYFLAFAGVQLPSSFEGSRGWTVFIKQNAKDVFQPLKKIMRQMLAVSLFLVVLLVPTVFLSGQKMSDPIKQLHQATEEIARGNLDYRVELKTGDEIEDLARSFNQMATTLKGTQGRLLQSEKLSALGRLSAGIAHEINNPIGFVSSNLTTLREYLEVYTKLLESYGRIRQAVEAGDLEKARFGIKELRQLEEELNWEFISGDIDNILKESSGGIDRIKKINADLKLFARKDTEEKEMHPHKVEEILESALNVVYNELKYKTEIKKEYGDIPQIPCDAQKLGQVFMNLLINAGQAIEKKGTITLKTWTTDTDVRVAISDTGAGIPPEKLPQIFEPFFTTKPSGVGTGLGLSISHEIVQKHGGQIKVTSEVEEGTTFTVILPKKTSA